MKHLIFYFLLLCTFISSFVSNSFAETAPVAPPAPVEESPPAPVEGVDVPPLNANGAPFCQVAEGVYLDSCETGESSNSVLVRFYGFRVSESEQKEQFGKYFCYKSDQSKCEKDDFKEAKHFTDGSKAIIEEQVCGDGKDRLMGKSHKRKDGCQKKDYFHQGKIYRLGLYYEKDKKTKITEAVFFIKHTYPTVDVKPLNPSEKAEITVVLSGKRESQDKSGDNQNNYMLLLQGRDIKLEPEPSACIVFDSSKNKPNSHIFKNLARGKYQLKVQERVGEDGSNCKGGFTYWTIPITVGTPDIFDTSGKLKEKGTRGHIGKPIKDPHNVESRQQSQNTGKLPPPCAVKDRTSDGRCLAVQTAIGRISVQPDTFVSGIYGWFLSLASVAGFILLLRAGYKLLTSGGNKEKVGEAREEIKSVIFGILFLVVALVMLEAIGTDILKIPGFK